MQFKQNASLFRPLALTCIIMGATAIDQAQALTSTPVREELFRYTLLSDRMEIYRAHKNPEREQFFKLDLAVSSGLKDLIGDIKSGNSSSSNAVTKQIEILGLLNKSINTERYVDLKAGIGIPLPYFSISKIHFLPSLFYELGLGASLSISNFGDVQNPRAQTYVKKETKMGLESKVSRTGKFDFSAALYTLDRADASNTLTATNLAAGQDLVSFDSLNQSQKFLAFDFAVTKKRAAYQYTLKMRELPIKTLTETRASDFGKSPLLQAGVEREFKFDAFTYQWSLGVHYRKRYALADGFFLYQKLYSFKTIPITLHSFLDNESLFISPSLKFSICEMSYGYKLIYRNPIDNMWVPGVHNILFSVNFPAP